jgi:hypothetical protein
LQISKAIKYELIIYWSKSDQAFIVEVPELPGCMADGQTYVEAVTNAEVSTPTLVSLMARFCSPIRSRVKGPAELVKMKEVERMSS